MDLESSAVKPSVAADESVSMKSYVQLKEQLLRYLVDAAALLPEGEGACSELREKLEANVFNLVVVGQFKRGKTYLINALMGEEILPVAVVPLTSIVTILKYGEALGARVIFNDENVLEIDPDQIQDYVTETGNPRNVKGVREVVITYPSAYLKDGVRLIDTPGVGSIYLHNTDVAYQYLPKSDAALFLLSVDQPVSKSEVDFLSDVKEYSNKIFFLLNKIDYLSGDELKESLAFTQKALLEVMGEEMKIFPVSAKQALNGKLTSDDALLLQSNLPGFAEVLNRFLLMERGKILLTSVIRNLLRLLSQTRLQWELEQRSLATPLDELREKLTAFEEKKREILHERQNIDILLDGELNRFVKSVLDEDLTVLKKEIRPSMERELNEFYDAHSDLSLKELNDVLERYILEKVQGTFNEWRRVEEGKVSEAFEAICDRFIKKISEIVDELLLFSSELFSIPFEIIKVESVWSSNSNFYYKLKDEPVGLDLLTDSLTQVLPGYISNRFEKFKAYVFKVANGLIFNKRKRHMLETIDMQAGRMRADFLNRLTKGKQGFRRQILERIDDTMEGISLAIQKGMEARMRGEREAEHQGKVLSDRLENLENLRQLLFNMEKKVQQM